MAWFAAGTATTQRLLDLVGDQPAAGKQVHHANVAAVALAHGAEAIVTDNARHFTRFADLLRIETLHASPN